jgi:hypothetical protein
MLVPEGAAPPRLSARETLTYGMSFGADLTLSSMGGETWYAALNHEVMRPDGSVALPGEFAVGREETADAALLSAGISILLGIS